MRLVPPRRNKGRIHDEIDGLTEANDLAERLSEVLAGHDLVVAKAALASQVAAWLLRFETHEQRLNQLVRFVDLVRTLARRYENDPRSTR